MTKNVSSAEGRSDSRRHHRVTVPLTVVIEGQPHPVLDWSLCGFRVEEFSERAKIGTEHVGHLILPYDAFALQLEMRFRIVRQAPGGVGCEFVDLPPPARRALRHLLEAAMEGRLDDVDGALAMIEAPIPTKKPEHLLMEEDDSHVQVGRKKATWKTSAYLGLGAVALLVALVLLYRNLAFLDIPAGTVMGNFVSVASRVDGRLAELWAEEGRTVRVGQPLFALSNPDLEESVALAEAGLTAARARHEALREQLEEEMERLTLYSRITVSQRAGAALREAEARMRQATINRSRLEKLYEQGLLPQSDLDEALEEERVLQERIEGLQEEVSIAETNVEDTSKGRFLGGQEIEGRVTELREAVTVSAAEEEEAKRGLSLAMTKLEETRVRSPVQGTVYTVYRRPGELLHARDAVLSIRTDDGYWATGRLTEDEVARVRPGQAATVAIPSYGITIQGVVNAVGHQGLSTASRVSADMETAPKEVPLKIQLLDAPLGLPPGIRARIRIHTGNPLLAWFRTDEDETPQVADPFALETMGDAEETAGVSSASTWPSEGGTEVQPLPAALPPVPLAEESAPPAAPDLSPPVDVAAGAVEAEAPEEVQVAEVDDVGEPTVEDASTDSEAEPPPVESEVPPVAVADAESPVPAVPARTSDDSVAGADDPAPAAVIQLGAFGTVEAAREFGREMRRDLGDVLQSYPFHVRAVSPGEDGSLHRLLLGPMGSREEAVAVCGRLQERGRDCLVRPGSMLDGPQ